MSRTLPRKALISISSFNDYSITAGRVTPARTPPVRVVPRREQ
jgi:hypothetical protein